MLWLSVILSALSMALFILLLRAIKKISNQSWEIAVLQESVTAKEEDQDHRNEIAQIVLKEAPCIRFEPLEHFQSYSPNVQVRWSELDVFDGEESGDVFYGRTKVFRFSNGFLSDKNLARPKSWTAITIINNSNCGFEITAISTVDDKKVAISDSGENMIDSKRRVTYLFPYRDSPEIIYGKFQSLALYYPILFKSGYSTPQIDS